MEWQKGYPDPVEGVYVVRYPSGDMDVLTVERTFSVESRTPEENEAYFAYVVDGCSWEYGTVGFADEIGCIMAHLGPLPKFQWPNVGTGKAEGKQG